MKKFSVQLPTTEPGEFWTPIDALAKSGPEILGYYLGATARGVKGARIVDLKGKPVNPDRLKNDVSKTTKAPRKS